MKVVIHDGKKQVMVRGAEKDFELCEERKQGEATIWTAVGWYSDLGAALNAILKRKVRNSTAKTLEELKQVILAAKAELTEVWSLNHFNKAA